jgi:hypothetical protein
MMHGAAPAHAPVCNCARPLLNDGTCLRCGRPPATEPGRPEPAGGAFEQAATNWTRARILRAFEAFAFFRGRAPVVADWSRRMDNWPPREAVEAMFGSVAAACAAAGLERSSRDVTRR